MLTLTTIPPAIFYLMSDIQTGGGATVDGDVRAANDFAGRDSQRYDSSVHISFDRASNWDEEREQLTTLQRIRDLETYIYGDRRGLITGVLRQMRSHVLWLIILSVLQSVTVILLALLVLRIWGAAL